MKIPFFKNIQARPMKIPILKALQKFKNDNDKLQIMNLCEKSAKIDVEKLELINNMYKHFLGLSDTQDTQEERVDEKLLDEFVKKQEIWKKCRKHIDPRDAQRIFQWPVEIIQKLTPENCKVILKLDEREAKCICQLPSKMIDKLTLDSCRLILKLKTSDAELLCRLPKKTLNEQLTEKNHLHVLEEFKRQSEIHGKVVVSSLFKRANWMADVCDANPKRTPDIAQLFPTDETIKDDLKEVKSWEDAREVFINRLSDKGNSELRECLLIHWQKHMTNRDKNALQKHFFPDFSDFSDFSETLYLNEKILYTLCVWHKNNTFSQINKQNFTEALKLHVMGCSNSVERANWTAEILQNSIISSDMARIFPMDEKIKNALKNAKNKEQVEEVFVTCLRNKEQREAMLAHWKEKMCSDIGKILKKELFSMCIHDQSQIMKRLLSEENLDEYDHLSEKVSFSDLIINLNRYPNFAQKINWSAEVTDNKFVSLNMSRIFPLDEDTKQALKSVKSQEEARGLFIDYLHDKTKREMMFSRWSKGWNREEIGQILKEELFPQASPSTVSTIKNLLKNVKQKETDLIELLDENIPSWNFEAFENMFVKQKEILAEDLPTVSKSDVREMMNNLKDRIKENSPELQKEFEDLIMNMEVETTDFDFLCDQFFTPPVTNYLRKITDPKQVIHENHAKFIILFDHIRSQDNTPPQQKNKFSPQETALLQAIATIQTCSTGKHEAINGCYKLLPLSVKIHLEEEMSESPKIVKEIFKEYVEQICSGSGPIVERVIGQTGSQIKEPPHQEMKLKNVLSEFLGFEKLEDPYERLCVHKNMKTLKAEEAKKLLMNHLSMKRAHLVNKLVEAINEEIDRNPEKFSDISAMIAYNVKEEFRSQILVEDPQDIYKYHITPIGVKILLSFFNFSPTHMHCLKEKQAKVEENENEVI